MMMAEKGRIIHEIEIPQWIEEALAARSELYHIRAGEYLKEILTAHFEGRPFDINRLLNGGK